MRYTVEEMPRDIGSRIWPTLIAPRPVMLIASTSMFGVPNIAPYNSISCVSSYPPVVSISFGKRRGEPKNTLLNILETRQFTLNAVPKALAETANAAAEGVDVVDDFQRLGLTPLEFDRCSAFGIVESTASISCELTQSIAVEGTQCLLILARCVEVAISDGSDAGGVFDPALANLVASVGVENYITVKGEPFTLPRLWE